MFVILFIYFYLIKNCDGIISLVPNGDYGTLLTVAYEFKDDLMQNVIIMILAFTSNQFGIVISHYYINQ